VITAFSLRKIAIHDDKWTFLFVDIGADDQASLRLRITARKVKLHIYSLLL
jgi:predicted metal-binding protein